MWVTVKKGKILRNIFLRKMYFYSVFKLMKALQNVNFFLLINGNIIKILIFKYKEIVNCAIL